MSKTSLLNTVETLLGMGGEFADIAKFVKEQLATLETDAEKTIVDLKSTIEGLKTELESVKSENIKLSVPPSHSDENIESASIADGSKEDKTKTKSE